jgi:hypothetical protein
MPIKTNADNRDPKQSNSRLTITDFKGMAPSQDPHDLDPSLSAFQVNCFAIYPGQLTARKGLKLVQFLT